MAENRSICQ